jgi:hypothetical protein
MVRRTGRGVREVDGAIEHYGSKHAISLLSEGRRTKGGLLLLLPRPCDEKNTGARFTASREGVDHMATGGPLVCNKDK